MSGPISSYGHLFSLVPLLPVAPPTGFVSATQSPATAPLRLSTEAWDAVQTHLWNQRFLDQKKESVQGLRSFVEKTPRLTDDVFFHILSLACEGRKTVELGLLLEEKFGDSVLKGRIGEAFETLWRLEADFLNAYRGPSHRDLDFQRETVARYLGVLPSERPAKKSLAVLHPDEAEALFDRAEREPAFRHCLFSVAQISDFLNRMGKTRYSNEPSSLVEYLLDGRADCETGSFLFSHLASLIGLPVSLGRSSNHCFLYAANETVVIECTAFYQLRPLAKYRAKERSHYNREPEAGDRHISRIFRDRLANLWIVHSGRIALSHELELLRLLHRMDSEAFEHAMVAAFLEGLEVCGVGIEGT